MKTITSLLLGVLLTILSFFFIGLAVNSVNLSTNDYITTTSTVTQSYFASFIIVAIVQVLVAFVCIIAATLSFKAFITFYNNYLYNKRDRDIKRQAVDAHYEELYSKLRGTNILEDKRQILKDFYQPNKRSTGITQEDWDKMLDKLIEKE